MKKVSQSKKAHQQRYIQTLQSAGITASSARVHILAALDGTPSTFSELKQKLGTKVHQATLYRALPELVISGVIVEIDLPGPETRYEFSKRHHHHIVCEVCGTVEGIPICIPSHTVKKMLAQAKHFNSVRHHSLEFLGTCNTCSS